MKKTSEEIGYMYDRVRDVETEEYLNSRPIGIDEDRILELRELITGYETEIMELKELISDYELEIEKLENGGF